MRNAIGRNNARATASRAAAAPPPPAVGVSIIPPDFARRFSTPGRVSLPSSSSASFSSTAPRDIGDSSSKLEYDTVPKDDYGEYQEYSVIFTNRSLNLMSKPFQRVMRDLNDLLKTTYNAHKVAIIPG
jgi:hypothetical protein